MKKEELIQELIVQLIQIEGRSGDMNYIRGVADLILAREQAILSEIEKPLKECQYKIAGELVHLKARNMSTSAMNDALATITRLRETDK